MLKRIALFFLIATTAFGGENGKVVPTIDDLLKVESVGSVQISPDGKRVAYTVSGANLEENAYISHIWLANLETGELLQLTRVRSLRRIRSGPRTANGSRLLPVGMGTRVRSTRFLRSVVRLCS